MANRNFSDMQSLNKEVKLIAGRFSDAGTVGAGLGWSAADTGTGEYTVTLQDTYNALLSASAMVAGTDGYAYTASVESHDVTSTKAVVFKVAVNGTLTDMTGDQELHFALMLQNSSVANK